MGLTLDIKRKIADALIKVRPNYGGNDIGFANKFGIAASVYSQIKGGAKLDGLLSEVKWVSIARALNIDTKERKWKIVATDVYLAIKSDIEFCKANAKAMSFVDDCEIGKTVAAQDLSHRLVNCFYVDASQCKTKRLFINALAQAIGLKEKSKYAETKENIKWYLKSLDNPIVIVDEAGDLEYPAFLELKEFWNATDGLCAWYMIGADGLKAKFEHGISNRKVGYREIFSRFGSKYQQIVPALKADREAFYKKLLTDVLTPNMEDVSQLPMIVKKCLANDSNGILGGIRQADYRVRFAQQEKQAA